MAWWDGTNGQLVLSCFFSTKCPTTKILGHLAPNNLRLCVEMSSNIPTLARDQRLPCQGFFLVNNQNNIQKLTSEFAASGLDDHLNHPWMYLYDSPDLQAGSGCCGASGCGRDCGVHLPSGFGSHLSGSWLQYPRARLL